MEASVASPARTGSPRAVRGWWAEARGYQRLAYLVGAGLIVIGLAHAAMWALAGGSASGPVSWRKPTTFGISFGLTTVTLAAFLHTTAAAPLAVAIRWGLLGLLVAQVSGVWILLHGLALLDDDADPSSSR